MAKLFKKNFFKITITLVLLSVVLGTLLPIHQSYAQTLTPWIPIKALGSSAVKVAQAILGSFLWLIVFLAEGVLAIGIALLSGVIGFTLKGAVSLTNPAKNEIINIGWTLIRDFVNIGFILGLVYIGLATALRIAGFELKKVFPWFLIMALLINFTPVICGVVVDAANMVTKFFLEAMANWTLLGEVFKLHMTGIGDLFGGLGWVPVAKFAFLIAFGFAAGFVLLIFAVLLLLRAVVIPILVIFSPLAFLAYIFPRTRSYFTQWWNQLLQWSFIGAIGGFFLYLSRLALRQQADFSFAIPTEDPALGTFMEQIAPYFMAVAFLMVGLFITLKSSAMGANMVTGFAKKQGMKALKWGGKAMGGAGAATVGAVRGATAGEGVKGRAWEAFKGAVTPGGREKGREVVEGFLEKAHLVRPGFYEKRRRERWKLGDLVKSFEKLPIPRLNEIMKRVPLRPADEIAKAAITEVLGKKHAFVLETLKKEKGAIRRAQTFGVDLSELAKGRPDLAPVIKLEKILTLKAQGLSEEEASSQVIKETLQVMSPKQLTKVIQPTSITPEVYLWLSAPQMKNIGSAGTLEQRKKIAEVSISPALHNYQQKLQRQGKTTEVNKIQYNANETAYDPNFQGLI